jgi:Domain of unknown function (DUF1857)
VGRAARRLKQTLSVGRPRSGRPTAAKGRQMFTTTHAERINGDNDTIRLTPEQVWRALEIRARNGDDRFVPPHHRFDVLEDDGNRLLRRVHLDGREDELQEITFHGGRVNVFNFIEGPQRSIIICNLETDDDCEYWLRFTFLSEFTDIPHGSEEEVRIAAERRPLMRRQPGLVLSVARELVSEGRL